MKKQNLNRRAFIKTSSIGVLGAGVTRYKFKSRQNIPDQDYSQGIKEYRRLGRTGAMVSDIGSGDPNNEYVLKAAIDAGVNFIETSESYDNGRNEVLIGNVMKNYDREKLFITTKANPAYRLFKSADDIIRRAEGSLQRLQTNYIDLYMIHQVQNLVRVSDKYFHRACDTLKKNGKIRYTGLSCHGWSSWQEPLKSLEDILMAAIEDERFDVLFFPYNFIDAEMGERIIQACKEKDIGTMIMKANPVVTFEYFEKIKESGRNFSRTDQKDYERLKSQMESARGFFEKYKMTDTEKIKDGAIQFILTNKDVGTICCRFSTFSDVEKYTRLSGTTLDSRISKMLAEFKDKLGFLNCRIGCNICEIACPNNVPVNTIMRYNYYYITQKREKTAMLYYRELKDNKAEVCSDCEGLCEKACPYGVATQELLSIAHQNLYFDNTYNV